MNPYIIGLLFFCGWLLFAVPTLIFLIRAYAQSRMTGFLWLIAALVVWPAIARLLPILLPSISTASGISNLLGVPGLSAYLGLSLVKSLIGGALVLTSIVVLSREVTTRVSAPASPLAPPRATYPQI